MRGKMKKFTKEDGIDKLRSEKGKEGTMGGMFYALLNKMDPAVAGKIEDHCGEVLAAGFNIGAAINEAEKDPVKKKQMADAIIKAAAGKNSNFSDEE